MTKSKRADEGLLIIDNRNSPGVPDHWMPNAEEMPSGSGQGLFEAPTYTCSHCPQIVVMNPLRRRPRGYCRKCDAYICDRCNGILAATRECKPWNQVLDEVQEQVVKEEQAHGNAIISSTNINTDGVR